MVQGHPDCCARHMETASPGPRVLILGDSMPFYNAHYNQRFEFSWPVLLKTRVPGLDLWPRFIPAILTDDLIGEFTVFEDALGAFDSLIIQIGINDSCPRPFPRFVHRFLTWIGNKKLKRVITKNYARLLRYYCRPWTSEGRFRTNVEAILHAALTQNPTLHVYIVRIPPPCKGLVKKVPMCVPYVGRYNQILVSICNSARLAANVHFVDPFEGRDVEELIIEDGHHLSYLGHEVLSAMLADMIRRP